MIKKMKKFNIPLIPAVTGGLALIAVIAVIIVVFGGMGGAGLYITEASGTVSITSGDAESDKSSGEALTEGDIITVGADSTCRIVYKTKKNADDIYMIVSENTQIALTSEPKGKDGGEFLLNRGSVLCNFSELKKTPINIRTADAKVFPSGTVTKVAWLTEDFSSYTDVYSFKGNSKIQLYDSQGNAVNNAEFLAEKRAGRVSTNSLGPVFSFLNNEFSLTSLNSFDLKNLVALSQLDDDFPYTTPELKAAYDAVSDSPEQTSVPDTSDIIQTAETIDTSSSELVTDNPNHDITPPSTTQKPVTTTVNQPVTNATTTASQPSVTTADGGGESAVMHTVIIVIGDEEMVQNVEHGSSADKPADPEIDGKTFVGWDGSFDNITEDTTITAIFEDSSELIDENYHTVTIVIGDRSTTVQVADGDPAPLPETVSIEGYTFMGWDRDYSAIYSDITITAILQPNNTAAAEYTVTFMIGGIPYPTIVTAGGNAIAPVTPTMDADGNAFIGWDKPLENITSDVTITALFASPEYTVTFVVDGISYPVKVKKGEAAVVPVNPTTDALGRTFIGWDTDFNNVQGNLTVNAIFM